MTTLTYTAAAVPVSRPMVFAPFSVSALNQAGHIAPLPYPGASSLLGGAASTILHMAYNGGTFSPARGGTVISSAVTFLWGGLTSA